MCWYVVQEILEETKEMNNDYRGGKEGPHKMGDQRQTFCCTFFPEGRGGEPLKVLPFAKRALLMKN